MSARDDNNLYTVAQLESYAAARVAEATAELQRRVAELEANDRRYRFLRDAAHTIGGMSPAVVLATENFDVDSSECGGFVFSEELDSTIDAILADREGGKA